MEGELPRVFDTIKRKARKDHRCQECDQTIRKGANYIVSQGLWNDTGWSTFKACLFCEGLRQWAMEKVMNMGLGFQDEDGPSFTWLYQWCLDYEIDASEFGTLLKETK